MVSQRSPAETLDGHGNPPLHLGLYRNGLTNQSYALILIRSLSISNATRASVSVETKRSINKQGYSGQCAQLIIGRFEAH